MQPDLRTIYGLPLTKPAVVVVEGEKCADAVVAAGLPAVTWQGGASSVAKSDWSPLAGKICFIWPDNDQPGLKAKADLIAALAPIAAEIRIIQIPDGKPEGWDAADTTPAEILRLVDEAVLLDPADYPQPEVEEKPVDDAPSNLPKSFPILRSDQLRGSSEAMDFVEGLLTEGGASVVYGPSNCGKSFWAFDLAACVATGRQFRDELEVDQGAVVYVP